MAHARERNQTSLLLSLRLLYLHPKQCFRYVYIAMPATISVGMCVKSGQEKKKPKERENKRTESSTRENFNNPLAAPGLSDTRVSSHSRNEQKRTTPFEAVSLQHFLNSHVCGRGRAQGKRQMMRKARVWIIPASASRDVNYDIIIILHPGLIVVRYESAPLPIGTGQTGEAHGGVLFDITLDNCDFG